MVPAGYGKIINISSVAGLVAMVVDSRTPRPSTPWWA